VVLEYDVQAMAAGDSGKIRVMLVDDHLLVMTALKMALEDLPDVELVGTATNINDALDVAGRGNPEVILLDLNLNGTNSLTSLPKLKEAAPQSRVIILTAEHDAEAHRQAVKLGAVGLVLKNAGLDVLVKAIRKVHQGEAWFDRAMMSNLIADITQRQGGQKADDAAQRISTLTERERGVIELIGEGLKNKQIAERLFISETTVHHHLTSIFGKLGVQDRVGLVIFAIRHNLVKLPR
jgi:two-component system, NarL family, nitrate/nitrite response regulator NarL